MTAFLKKYRWEILLGFFIAAYILYFSLFTIKRLASLYAYYFDLGIMHQTVYNSYQAIVRGDWGRFLELTDPDGPLQIKRMAIHNDLLLALLSPLYFIHSGPETLLVIQTVVVAFGALAVYLLAKKVIKSKPYAFAMAFSYLIFSPLQRANIFDFHAVTLSVTFLLFMFYFSYVKKFFWSFVFFLLSLSTKEQVALTTCFFGVYYMVSLSSRSYGKNKINRSSREVKYGLLIIIVSTVWFIVSNWLIIPYFRQGQHFAMSYYSDIRQPFKLLSYIFHWDNAYYLFRLFLPVAFLPFFALDVFFISLPELAINFFSNNWFMRNINLHYVAVIIPFVFISAVFSTRRLINRFNKLTPVNIAVVIVALSLMGAYWFGPLPFSRDQDIYPWRWPKNEAFLIKEWQQKLSDDSLKISATDYLAANFTSYRRFYIFSNRYSLADYILLRVNDIRDHSDSANLLKVYENLKKDDNYQLIYKYYDFEVYEKIKIKSLKSKFKIFICCR
ncbi:DUF2079 domain-containing protein [Candidatus Roizmanbacteria bacterium]|nr:DUF2079 domain-containing protein [Candidatus Roizmanbacteria bacterium]